ncbi:MAG: hypothetical protein CMI53_02620 [Parcubacteria group bacterium]|jgi:hypothetical protein|nr:hypothetical protein [Parcubacteria group bacterium]|tara:strand:+ start:8947 stop:9609 length:663 start_codon:yes stop_codon:yes gene_type:complete
MIWQMRWMTRYLGFIARPFIKWYASQEIIACGLRSPAGQFNIIFTKTNNKKNYKFFKKIKRHWQEVDSLENQDFSYKLMFQEIIPYAEISEIYKVKAKKTGGKRIYSSPKILIKKKTDYKNDLLTIEKLGNGQAKISWPEAEKYKPMIYFLAIEDSKDHGICGIYTRENNWLYPQTKKASLSINKQDPPLFKQGQEYSCKLVAVDYDGWVPCVATIRFTY